MSKNLLLSTSDRPLRIALLGPPKSSKTAIVSIISNDKSPENYYPTIENSPTLVQFQPKSPKARTILDINASSEELKELGIDEGQVLPLVSGNHDPVQKDTSSEHILKKTQGFYDLEYDRPNYFETELISPAISPTSSDSSQRSRERYKVPLKSGYVPPITTPLLLELIDTPGVQKNDLIPFLEKGLDSKLASDILRNLLNEADAASRSRVKPLITGSGMSELNAAMDGYLLCYSAIPETDEETLPPSYDAAESGAATTTTKEQTFEPIEVLKALYNAILEAWKQYTSFHTAWEDGQEFDIYSLNYSFKHLWKKRASAKDMTDAAIIKKAKKILPPILIAVTHVDHELASPLLIGEGRKLAKQWGCGFIEVSCEYENWRNVEEAVAALVREMVERKNMHSKKR